MAEQKKRGRWKPGESGNLRGRPSGTGQVALLRSAIAERLPELLESLMTRALAGDVAAARLLLERSIAPLRPVEQSVTISMADGSLSDQARAVLAAAGTGEVTPSQAAQLVGAIAALAKIIEIADLDARLAILEARHAAA
jgi:hypothetical protein